MHPCTLETMTDDEIIYGCIANNRVAQKKLFDKFSRRMMGICQRYTENNDEAKDFLQDGFIRVYESIKTYSGGGSLQSWIRSVMINAILDTIRKSKDFRAALEYNDEQWVPQSEEQISGIVHAKDLLDKIKSLPQGYRVVFNLYAIEGYSHKEIADILKIDINTSKSQYSRAKSLLQKMLQPETENAIQ